MQVCPDLTGKEPHRQVGLDGVIFITIYADGAAKLQCSKNRGNPRYRGDLSSLASVSSSSQQCLHPPPCYVILPTKPSLVGFITSTVFPYWLP